MTAAAVMGALEEALAHVDARTVRVAVFVLMNAVFVFEMYVLYRQHRRLCVPARPAELAPLCTEEEYGASRAYAADRILLAYLETAAGHVVACGTLFSAAMPYVWRQSGRLVVALGGARLERAAILQSVVYAYAFILVGAVTDLPLAIYSTFRLERRHGFNKTTAGTFVADKLKSLVLYAVIAMPLLGGLLAVVEWAGRRSFVLYVGAFCLAAQLVMLLLVPTLIQPLFNKFTPLAYGPLRIAIEKLAGSVAFPLTKIFVIDGSRRSSHSNAYFYGLFREKRIVLYDTLIAQMATEEVCAIVAHELGHWALNHMAEGLAIAQAYILLLFSLFQLVSEYDPMFEAFGFPAAASGKPILIGLALFGHIMIALNVVVSFAINLASRRREFQADRYAVAQGYGAVLPKALLKLYKENKSFVHYDRLYSTMHHSHPPPSERIAAISAIVAASAKKAT